MSLLIFSYRKLDLIRRKIDTEFKLMRLSQLQFDLQSYGASISDGEISMRELSTAPASVFNRMNTFMMTSHMGSMNTAQQNFQFMQQTPGMIPQMPDPSNQAQYNQMVFKNLYEQERQKYQKAEENILNEKDKMISMERSRIEAQLKMIEAELESVKGAEDKAAKDSAPKYA